MNTLLVLIYLPAYLLGRFFLANDPGPREPKSALRRAVGFGVLALVLAVAASYFIDYLMGRETLVEGLLYPSAWSYYDHISLFLRATTEEVVKFVPLAVYIYHRRYFNEITDGLIYFIMVGLAFGVVETIGYAVYDNSIGVVMLRFALGLFLHAATTGAVGFVLARKKMKHFSMLSVVLALVGVSVLHYLYNLGIAISSESEVFILLSIAVSFSLNGAMFWLFYKAAKDDILSGRLDAIKMEVQQSHQYAQEPHVNSAREASTWNVNQDDSNDSSSTGQL